MSAAAEIGPLRLAAQRLVGEPAADPADAVRRLTAVQAQAFAGALTSVALRTAERRRAAVEQSLDEGAVVRSWPMRGTLHFVAAEDLAWMLALLAPRVVKAATSRRTALGLDESQLRRAREVAVDALEGGRALRRAELFARWDAAGLATAGQRGSHMLGYLSMTGVLVFGPSTAGGQLVVLLDEWIPAPRALERQEALAELAWRYFAGHGPATLEDFVRWTGLLVRDARAGLAAVRGRLEALEVDGAEYLMDPETPERLAAARAEVDGVLLLPGFDEYLLGYRDRRAVLDEAFADRIVPGGNGMFRATIVSAGRVVGTWAHTGTGKRRTVSAELFGELPATAHELIARAYERLP